MTTFSLYSKFTMHSGSASKVFSRLFSSPLRPPTVINLLKPSARRNTHQQPHRKHSGSPHTSVQGDRTLLEFSKTAEEDSWSFSVIPDFISSEEEKALLVDINRTLRGKRYQHDHWDGAIRGYRETEKSQWQEVNRPLIERLKSVTSTAVPGRTLTPLPDVHVLDLDKDGHIEPHIDSVKFCGEVITGLSLLSPSVYLMQHEEDPEKWVCALLPRLSLYIMRGVIRYKYTHAIPPNEQSLFRNKHIVRDRRVSIICRTQPDES